MDPENILLSAPSEAGLGTYRFVCPACLNPVEKRADRKVVDLLRSVGVQLTEDGQGELLTERPDHPEVPMRAVDAAPAFTYDDLLSFHFLLEDDARLAAALTTIRTGSRGSPPPGTS
ncbi:MAG TPA: hypothetical protein VEN82_06085 [Actinomycetota bacterium]|nr:hypothetical protein [Actinomycetota bacterium]